MNREESVEPKLSHQSSADIVMKFLGMTIFVAGVLICVIAFIDLKSDTSEFGGIAEGIMIVYVGLPLILVGFVVFLIGLVI